MVTGLTKNIDLTAPAPAGVSLIEGNGRLAEANSSPETLSSVLTDLHADFLNTLKLIEDFELTDGIYKGMRNNPAMLDSHKLEEELRSRDKGAAVRRNTDNIAWCMAQRMPWQCIRETGAGTYFSDDRSVYLWKNDDELFVFRNTLEQREANYGIKRADIEMWQEFLWWGYLNGESPLKPRFPMQLVLGVGL